MTDTPVDAAVAALTSESPETEAHRLLHKRENVILYGPPGTGKSRAAQLLADDWARTHGDARVFHTTFHPSYSYEDFIEGFRPDPNDPARFVLTDGILFRAAQEAEHGPTLLVIDEINRADVAKVFGELITYIEADKRGRDFTTSQRPGQWRSIPADLYLLGTMNTADKSISLLDVALRRRFKFIECPPTPSAFTMSTNWKDSAYGVDLGDLLSTINDRLLGAGVTRDRLVGQALLGLAVHGDDAELLDRLRYDVYPLVDEYLFGDAERMADVLPGLVDDHGALVPSALTPETIRSWVSDESDQVSADDGDDGGDSAETAQTP